MASLVQDLRYGLRTMRRSPGFVAVVVITLALGIGANSTIFSLVSALVLRPVPGIARPGDLVEIRDALPYPTVVAYRGNVPALAALAAYRHVDMDVRTGDATERVRGALVSANYFQVLGVTPAVGRVFLPDEETVPGGHPLAVIGHDLWRERLGADPDAIGATIRVNTLPFTVIGVAPARFHGLSPLEDLEVWVPLDMYHEVAPGVLAGLHDARWTWLNGVGRLRPGATVAAVAAQVQTIDRRLAQANPKRADHASRVSAFRADERAFVAEYLALLAAIVGTALLIACANVASLLLAQGTARRRELAIRSAVGAGRGRVARQLVLESLLLAGAGAALGLLFAAWATRLLRLWILASDPTFPRWISLAPDARVLGFTIVAALGTGLLFGIVPALQLSQVDLVTDLKDGVPMGSRSRAVLRRLLVATQVTLSVVLLAGTGHLVREIRQRLAGVPVSAPDHVLQASLDPAAAGYEAAGARDLYRRLLERLAAVPTVSAVSLGRNGGPWDGSFFDETAVVEGVEGPDSLPDVRYDVVSPGYFAVLGTTLLTGRPFTTDDREGRQRVAIVNERFARRFWPGASPIGKRFRLLPEDEREVVGLARDRSHAGPAPPFIYLPLDQDAPWPLSHVTLRVRITGSADDLIPVLRREIAVLDASLALLQPRTMARVLRDDAFDTRLVASVLGAAGLLALGLSAVGLYALIAHAVGQRLPEFGVRRALGATAGDVLAAVMGEGMRVIGYGLVVGVPIALAFTPVLLRLVFGSRHAATDPMVLVLAAATLAVVGAIACLVPAYRATRVDPVASLRAQ